MSRRLGLAPLAEDSNHLATVDPPDEDEKDYRTKRQCIYIAIFFLAFCAVYAISTILSEETFWCSLKTTVHHRHAWSKDYIVYRNCSSSGKSFLSIPEMNPKMRLVYIYEESLLECESVLVDAAVCFMKRGSLTSVRCLPKFMIVGFMKGGTGAYMSALQDVGTFTAGKGIWNKEKKTPSREMHFFDSVCEERPCTWMSYLEGFPQTDIRNLSITFDKTPSYSQKDLYLYRIRKILPSIKLIFILRDPVVRAISGFRHHCRHGRYFQSLVSGKRKIVNSLFYSASYLETGKFTKIAAPCSAREMLDYYDGLLNTLPSRLSYGSEEHQELDIGLYGRHIRTAVEIFGNSSVFLVLNENFRATSANVISDTLSFLNIDNDLGSSQEKSHCKAISENKIKTTSNLPSKFKFLCNLLWRYAISFSKGTNDLVLEDYESKFVKKKSSESVNVLVYKLKLFYRTDTLKLVSFLKMVYPSKEYSDVIELWL